MRRGQWLDWVLLAVLLFGMVWEGRWAVIDLSHSQWSHGLLRLLFAVVLLALAIASYRMRVAGGRPSERGDPHPDPS
jgi:hypothetical protein